MQTCRLLGVITVAILLLLVVAAGSDVQSAPTLPPTEATPEPITGVAETSPPSGEPPPFDPFKPYAIGGPEAAWKLSDLTTAEQTVAQRGLTTTGWSATHNAFASAVVQRAQHAAASAAAAQLGVDNLGTTGVVP